MRRLNIPRAEWEDVAVGELFDMIACWQIMQGAEQKPPEQEAWEMFEQMN